MNQILDKPEEFHHSICCSSRQKYERLITVKLNSLTHLGWRLTAPHGVCAESLGAPGSGVNAVKQTHFAQICTYTDLSGGTLLRLHSFSNTAATPD